MSHYETTNSVDNLNALETLNIDEEVASGWVGVETDVGVFNVVDAC